MKALKVISPPTPLYQIVFVRENGEMASTDFSVELSAYGIRRSTVVDVQVMYNLQSTIRTHKDAVERIDAARMASGVITFKKDGEFIGVLEGIDLQNEWIRNHPPLRYLRVFGEPGVKHTGRKRRYGRTLRSMKTLATLREAGAVVKDDGEPEFRGRRRTLPTAWDDHKIGSIEDRSWKMYRKTRWKVRK